jgi:hypothetical protein
LNSKYFIDVWCCTNILQQYSYIYCHHMTASEVIIFKKHDCEIYLLRLSSSEARNALRSTRHWTGKHI